MLFICSYFQVLAVRKNVIIYFKSYENTVLRTLSDISNDSAHFFGRAVIVIGTASWFLSINAMKDKNVAITTFLSRRVACFIFARLVLEIFSKKFSNIGLICLT